MKAKTRLGFRLVFLSLIVLTVIVAVAPDLVVRMPSDRSEGFLAPNWFQEAPDGRWSSLGTDYLGRPSAPVQ